MRLLTNFILGLFCPLLQWTTMSSLAALTSSDVAPLEWSKRLAYSQMERETRPVKWDYTMGLFACSLLKLNETAPDPRYARFAADKVGGLVDPDGDIKGYVQDEYQLDALNPGKTILMLWRITHEKRYQKAAVRLRSQFDQQPRTVDGGYWHKKRYSNQMWLDGLYMAAPFYAEYGALFDDPAAFDEVARQIHLMDKHAYDSKSGLFFHGWDAAKVQSWASPLTGCSSNFWGRAVGWYAMALVDTLDYFPTNHPAQAQIVATFQRLAAGVVKWQDTRTGLWWQIMDQGERQGNYLEASASAMFVYALAKGVNHGWLSRDYVRNIEKGYAGIINNLIQPDGNDRWTLAQCCSVAGLGFQNAAGRIRDGSFDYYISEPVTNNDLKGIGPFILAGIEMHHLHQTTDF